MATFYVSTSGSNTSPYDTWAKAALLPKTVTDYIATTSVSGNTIYIADGDYDNALMNLTDADHANLTVVGASRTGTILRNTSGGVWQIGAPSTGFSLSTCTVYGYAAANAVYVAGSSPTATITDVDFISAANHSVRLLNLANDATAVVTNCRFFCSMGTGGYSSIRVSNTANLTLAYCQVMAAGDQDYSNCVQMQSTGTLTMYNCIVSGSGAEALAVSSGTANVTNCILGPSGGYQADNVISFTGGTCNVTASLLLGDNQGTALSSAALTTDSGNLSNLSPKYTSYGRTGYIVVMIDDSGNLAHAQAAETAFTPYDFHCTWAISQAGWNSDNTAAARTLVTNGIVEIASHGYSHSAVSYANALRFTQTGGANPTVAFDGTTITCNCDGADYDQTYVVTNHTLAEIITALNGVKGWTVAKSTTGSQDVANINDNIKATSLATLVATPAPCDITFNRTAYDAGYLNDEITAPKAWMAGTLINGAGNVTDPQTGATYVCHTYVCPFNLSDATSNAAIRSAGYWGGRGAGNNGYTTDIGLFTLVGVAVNTAIRGDAAEATVRANARRCALWAIETARVVPIIVHTEMSAAEWAWIADEWSRFGTELKVVSMQEMAADIRAAPWTDDGDGTYSRTYSTYTDFHLLPGSPCINAGTNLGITYQVDYAGRNQNANGRAWDIGAYVRVQPKGDVERFLGRIYRRSRYR